MDKSPDAFRTISEVASDLDLPQHVLRFWETRFVQIRPLKRGGGRRYYRPDDVELLKGIRHLLYGEGYTIRGVQRILKEQGVRFVMNVWLEGAPQPPKPGTRIEPERESWDGPEESGADEAVPESDTAASFAEGAGWEDPGDFAPPPPEEPIDVPPPSVDEENGAREIARRFAPRPVGGAETSDEPVERPSSPPPRGEPLAGGPLQAVPRSERSPLRPSETRTGIDRFMDRLRSGVHPVEPAAEPPVTGSGRGLSRDEVRRLQATLFELLECKRLLDQER